MALALSLLSLHPLGSRTWHLSAFLRRIPLALESTGKNMNFIEDFPGESLDHVQLQ